MCFIYLNFFSFYCLCPMRYLGVFKFLNFNYMGILCLYTSLLTYNLIAWRSDTMFSMTSITFNAVRFVLYSSTWSFVYFSTW